MQSKSARLECAVEFDQVIVILVVETDVLIAGLRGGLLFEEQLLYLAEAWTFRLLKSEQNIEYLQVLRRVHLAQCFHVITDEFLAVCCRSLSVEAGHLIHSRQLE